MKTSILALAVFGLLSVPALAVGGTGPLRPEIRESLVKGVKGGLDLVWVASGYDRTRGFRVVPATYGETRGLWASQALDSLDQGLHSLNKSDSSYTLQVEVVKMVAVCHFISHSMSISLEGKVVGLDG